MSVTIKCNVRRGLSSEFLRRVLVYATVVKLNIAYFKHNISSTFENPYKRRSMSDARWSKKNCL